MDTTESIVSEVKNIADTRFIEVVSGVLLNFLAARKPIIEHEKHCKCEYCVTLERYVFLRRQKHRAMKSENEMVLHTGQNIGNNRYIEILDSDIAVTKQRKDSLIKLSHNEEHIYKSVIHGWIQPKKYSEV